MNKCYLVIRHTWCDDKVIYSFKSQEDAEQAIEILENSDSERKKSIEYNNNKKVWEQPKPVDTYYIQPMNIIDIEYFKQFKK